LRKPTEPPAAAGGLESAGKDGPASEDTAQLWRECAHGWQDRNRHSIGKCSTLSRRLRARRGGVRRRGLYASARGWDPRDPSRLSRKRAAFGMPLSGRMPTLN